MGLSVSASGAFLDVRVSEVLSAQDLQPLLDALDAARRRGPFVVITDTLAMKSAPRDVLKQFANQLNELPGIKSVWLADAVVLRSPIVRFAVSTLVLIAPLPTELKAFETRAEAERWCAQILQKNNIEVPPALRSREQLASR